MSLVESKIDILSRTVFFTTQAGLASGNGTPILYFLCGNGTAYIILG